MALYRLDYIETDCIGRPVLDSLGRDFLSTRLKPAKEAASIAAYRSGDRVQICKIEKAGHMRSSLIAQPDGTFHRA